MIYNFNTSNVTNMNYMFYGCSSLTSLNLSNFDLSKVTSMDGIFDNCLNLEYINIKNYDENNLNLSKNIFYNLPENLVICINEKNYKTIFELNKIKCYKIDCSDDWEKNLKKIKNENGTCIEGCKNNSKYKYEYNSKCIENCVKGLYLNNEYKCKCELDKCLSCPSEALMNNLCTECNIGYYTTENDIYNYDNHFDCYREPKGYYFDKNDSLYKKCYNSCDTCEIKGDIINHNCLECKSDYPFEISKNNYLKKDVTGFFSLEYVRFKRPGNPDFINVLKNTYGNENTTKLRIAAKTLGEVLLRDIPRIAKILGKERTELVLCSIPRAKKDDSYNENQLLFRTIISAVARKLNMTQVMVSRYEKKGIKKMHDYLTL